MMVSISIPLRAIGVAPQQGALILSLIGALIIQYQSTEARHLTWQALTSRRGIIISAVFVTWAITVPFSFAPLGSLEIGGRTGTFLLGVVFVWAALKTYEDVHELLWKTLVIASITSAVVSIGALQGISEIISIIKVDFNRPEAPTLELQVFAASVAFKAFAASTICMFPIVVWAGRRLGGAWRFWAYVYLPLSIIVILKTQNHAAIAGLLAMTITGMTVVVLNKHRHAKTLLVFSFIVATSILAWVRSDRLVFTTRNLDGMYLPEWLIDPHRQQIWKFAFNKFLENPWFGNGIDQLNKLSGAHETARDLGATAFLIPSHPHNWALEILAEAGVLGFLPVVIALAYVAWQLIRKLLKTQDEGALAQLTLLAGFWASALFNFSIWAVWWQLTFFILFAIVSAAPPEKHKQP